MSKFENTKMWTRYENKRLAPCLNHQLTATSESITTRLCPTATRKHNQWLWHRFIFSVPLCSLFFMIIAMSFLCFGYQTYVLSWECFSLYLIVQREERERWLRVKNDWDVNRARGKLWVCFSISSCFMFSLCYFILFFHF